MHIPDGYLSPATCATLYGGCLPFWYAGLERLKKSLHTRLVPLLSLLAAFCFVIMMFNLPLPGGTTGHAIGVTLAAIVLGPWASMLAVSIALIIQALFFGDGGITAIGANCFNMAVVGSLVAYGVYRAISGNAPIQSPRRVVGAALAGYFAINCSALLAAIEFGIQPLLYHDAAGVPLYCPYPLKIAVPAMMLGHVTVAGLAELLLSAGAVAFLQRSDPSLLRGASGLPATESRRVAEKPKSLRPLWLTTAALLILTPLGILAAGSAWGEWAASDYADPATRSHMATASLNHQPPAQAPQGLARLSSVWTAPFARYAPPYISSAGFGYLLSGMFGVGLVMLGGAGVGRVLRK
jgi:cobalt/nickel transport system permease protein